MFLIDVKTDNLVDYKKTSILLVFPYCSGKCGPNCQNWNLRKLHQTDYINVTSQDIVQLYKSLDTHNAVVMAGLEPLDSLDDVLSIIDRINLQRKACDIVIYTGYTEEEYNERFEQKIIKAFKANSRYPNKKLIVKIGRYDEDFKKSWHSDILGVNLATINQIVKIYNSDGSGYIERYKKEENNGNNKNSK